MRRKSPRFLAWLLAMSMLITTVPLSLADEITQAQSEPMEIVLQPVDISTDDSTQLNQDEVQKYQQIADELNQTNEQISIENENGLVVYSLKEGDEASDGAIVQEFCYSSDENAVLSLTSYAEITLASADGSEAPEEQAALMENAGALDEQIEQYNVEELDGGEPSTASTDALSDPSEEQTEFEDEYKSTQQTVITAEELLANINAGDEFSFAFAKRLGLGLTKEETLKNLQTLVTEYHEQIAKGVDFEEPRFIINGADIILNENIEELSLIKNDDGTYSVSMNETGETGYRTSVMIDADASVTIIYDEKGEANIERKVVSGKPTDFVITLDISGSMAWDGRDNAMFSALQVVLDEILAVKENTVSIVFWADNGAPMQINTSQNGVMQVFSGADGVTAQMLFDSNLVDSNGNVTSASLSSATISALERIYQTSSGTQPDKGLEVAYDLLNALENSENRNIGLMLFTDGAANYTSSERATVSYEKQIAEEFGATIVNVSSGDEYDVQKYERYLDPNSSSYYEKDNQLLQDHVLYYNIPKLSNQELADRVSEMFEIAFQEITTETKELQTETITDGVLAAYGAHLIETIPADFELVELRGDDSTVSYQVNGVDSEGNTTISFNLEEIISQKDMVLSYCVIPTQADNDIGVTAYFDKSETVLYAEPVDRIEAEPENQTVLVRVTELGDSQSSPDDPGQSFPTSTDDGLGDLSWWEKLFRSVKKFEKNRNDTTTDGESNRVSGRDEWQYMINFCQKLRDAGFDDDFIEECYKALASCENERMRELILMMFSSDLIDISRKTTNPDGTRWERSSYSTVIDGRLTIVYNGNTVDVRTVFHEIGHTIDYYAAQLENDEDGLFTVSETGVARVKTDVENNVRATVTKLVNETFKDKYFLWFKRDDQSATRETYIEYLTYKVMNENVPFSENAEQRYGITLTDELRDVYNDILSLYRTPFDLGRASFVFFQGDNLVGLTENSAYAYLVSDVYGGITNNNITDGYGHSNINDWNGSSYYYWYLQNTTKDSNGNTVSGNFVRDADGNAIFIDRRICEIWAEYTECIITDVAHTDSIATEFFPTYNIPSYVGDMHRIIADSI